MTSLVGQDSVWRDCNRLFQTPCHIFLTGPPGGGKSTLMRELLQMYATERGRPEASQWGVETVDECMMLGPEQDRGIQTIRGQVSLFIRQMSLGDDIYRWVVIDDVDTFPHISQQALRRPMESYSHITRFLFIGTAEEDLIPALRSRCIHLAMNPVDTILYRTPFLQYVSMPETAHLTDEMWNWMTAVSGNNISDLVRLLRLIRDVHQTTGQEVTLSLVRNLCSAPFYMDFFPLLQAMTHRDVVLSIQQLLKVWKKGYTYEDLLECIQSINQLFGQGILEHNVLIHTFLIRAWISYCKGHTSILALQHVVYTTLTDTSVPSMQTPVGLIGPLRLNPIP